MSIPKAITVRASVDIHASPEFVFSFLTDHKQAKRWQPDLVESQAPPEGGLRPGARFRVTVEEYGRRFDVEFVVASFELNRRIVYDMEAPTASVRGEYLVTPGGDGIRVDNTAVVTLKGLGRFLMPLLSGLLKRMFQRKLQSRLQLLHQAVEADCSVCPAC